MGRDERKRAQEPSWATWPNERLLDLPLCELGLEIAGTWLEDCVERLYAELEARAVPLRPHVWLSDDWFSPDGVSGFAVPFYLAHPRLVRLERQMMLEVEGGTREECMKLMRHETGHALQHGFLFHRRKRWRELFGSSAQPYPDYYRPRPASRRFVHHLDTWYAQSHPDEDFAETFAVWLKPRSDWRRRYAGWPAYRKLEYVEELIAALAGERPKVRTRARPDALPRLRKTLREHYDEKRERYSPDYSDAYDRDLQRLFVRGEEVAGRETAAAFLRRHRREIRTLVCEGTGQSPFTVDQVLKEMIGRARQLDLRVVRPERQLKLDFVVVLTVHTMHCLYRGQGWHPL